MWSSIIVSQMMSGAVTLSVSRGHHLLVSHRMQTVLDVCPCSILLCQHSQGGPTTSGEHFHGSEAPQLLPEGPLQRA